MLVWGRDDFCEWGDEARGGWSAACGMSCLGDGMEVCGGWAVLWGYLAG